MTDKEKDLTRQLAHLTDAERAQIIAAPDSTLPDVLKELGIKLPATNWILRLIKIILYAAGIVLAGLGTTSCVHILSSITI